MKDNRQIEEIQQLFQQTRDVPERSAEATAQGRAAFLQQAQDFEPAVSIPPKRRHIEWLNILFQKERVPMLATILVIFTLLFGGSGAVVFASQAAVPDQALYPLKMWSEQVRSQFTGDEESRFELMLRFADERIEEIEQVSKSGKIPQQGTLDRLRLHIDECINLAVQQQDAEMLMTMDQLRTRLQDQDHRLAQLQEQVGPDAEAILLRTRTMLQIRLQLAEMAQVDPQQFREQLRAGIPDQLIVQQQNREIQREMKQEGAGPAAETVEAPKPANSYGPGPNEGQQWSEDVPAPGSRYENNMQQGGNPWTDTTPTPGSGYGSGSEKGTNPWTDTTPTPGSSYGPGPGDGCTLPDGCPKNGEGSNGGAGGDGSGGSGGKK